MNKRNFWILRGLTAVVAIVVIAIQHRMIAQLNDEVAKSPKKPTPASSSRVAAKAERAQAIALDNSDLARILAMPDRFQRLRALLDFTAGLNGKDLTTVLQRLAGEESTLKGDNNFAISILVARLAQIDPKGALDWANTELKGAARRQILASLFDAWSSLDPAAALAGLDKIQNVNERAQFEITAFKNMASRDPQGALKILQSLPGGQQTHENYAAIFTTWAAADPAGAAMGVMALPPSRNRDFAIENVLEGWAQVDPRGALAWAGQLPGGVRAGALSTALGNLAVQDPKAAIDYFNSLTSPTDRNALAGVLASSWGKIDPVAAATWVDENVTGQSHDTAMLGLIGQLSETSPLQAASMLDRLPDRLQAQAITQIATNWAAQDIKGAMDWVQTQPGANPPNAQIKQLQVNMINNLTNVDPSKAAAYVLTIQDNPMFGRLVEQVAANWVGADPNAAFAWAKSLPMDGGGYNAMLQVITQYTSKDPVAAWNMATQLPDGTLRDNSMTNVFNKWVARNPADAAQQLGSLPEKSQVTATTTLATAWLNQDPQTAEKWINTLPTGTARDNAVSQIIRIEGSNDLPTAYTWATTIGNDALRYTQIRQVVQQWSGKDPAAAAAAVQNANVTEQQRAVLMSLAQRATPAAR